jgi:protein-L-isoaspartate(D-aspartate) O-methyltransferase
MVDVQLRGRGIRDPLVLAAMREVPREAFAAGASISSAYHDGALPIGLGQTISQPYMVARMIELLGLQGGEHVLEIGTGLGYEAAVLARIAGTVVTVERIPELAGVARATLADLGLANVEVILGDGSVGHLPRAPYDAIVVAAAAPAVPESLVEQLAPGGRLVVPVGSGEQTLVRVTKGAEGGHRREWFDRCVFVPLVGREGYSR